MPEIIEGAVPIGPAKLITARIEQTDDETLGSLTDQLAATTPNSIVYLASIKGDSATLAVKVSEDLIPQGYHAGNIMAATAPLADGGGGGGASFARGGGKASKIDEAFDGLRRFLEEQVAGEDSG